jgi:hypothetical protein
MHNTLHNKGSDRYYTMLERDGKLYEQRYQVCFEGQQANRMKRFSWDFCWARMARKPRFWGSSQLLKRQLSTNSKIMGLNVSVVLEGGRRLDSRPGQRRNGDDDIRDDADAD